MPLWLQIVVILLAIGVVTWTVNRCFTSDESRTKRKIFDLFNMGVKCSLEADALRQSGDILHAEQSEREAINHFDSVLQISPQHLGALGGKAMSLNILGQIQAASKLFLESTIIAPDNPEFYRQLSLCQLQLDDAEGAKKSMLRAIELADDIEYRTNAAIEIFNIGSNALRMAASYQGWAQPEKERRWLQAAHHAFTLSSIIDPSASHTQKAIEIVNTQMVTN